MEREADRTVGGALGARTWLFIALGACVGLALGIGGFTFTYAKGYAYLTNDPASCANCHVMREQYEGWMKSSHHAVATCNDCHTPSGLIGKYATKASNGFWHSFYFTTGTFHEPIQIRPGNREVTEQACRKCHGDQVEPLEAPHGAAETSCLRCHNSVGHPEGLGQPGLTAQESRP
ncbi:cytochrome c nitrite reductase small subunit [Archangium violaceum]|uniref:cytochrome c nitrite reductase small subunit n=1 Tax=Archangium violaceum TaxID=83451 RepID=UPI00193C602D|nr:cytochrome c nitrite reductase small subunit [Archangium violaceum]QRK04515.1 cytochrome c nitrite reductase small subunit [Archangium violaceum]